MFAVEIKDLNKKFGDFTAVNNLSLKIKKGQIYGLLGPNGAGKSTTIGIICGLLKVTGGKVSVLDVDVTKRMKGQNKKIGYVPQDISVYLELTAYENLKFFGQIYGLRGKQLEERIDFALEFTGLSDVRKKMANEFSGGMKRRLNIACAILHKPEIVIMDEPTVGIDPQSRNSILEAVKKLNESGVTVIYTTHYMEEVEAICSEIAIIDHGEVIVSGSKEELKSIVSEHNILEVSINNEEANLDGLSEIRGVSKFDFKENKITIFCDKEVNNLNSIIEFLGSKDIKISNIGFKDINLETVFLSLTGRSLRD
ncbi:MAG: ABC transporter ATP-binding protein [Sarcina sp.]